MHNKSLKSMHLLKPLLVGLGSLGLSLAQEPGTTANGNRQTEQESKVFTVAHNAQINVETFDGGITVYRWDKPEVKITVLKRAQDAEEMRGVSVHATQSGSEIRVVAAFDNAFKREVNFYGKRVLSSSASVDLELYVPREVSLVAKTSDGPITVEGGQGSLKAKTGDGRILVNNFTGAAEVHTEDGAIKLSGRFAQLVASTADGSISVALPSGFNATIETTSQSVHSRDGVVTAEEPASAPTSMRRWRAGKGGKVLKLRTDHGQISFRRQI
jgi:hypothetical protein